MIAYDFHNTNMIITGATSSNVPQDEVSDLPMSSKGYEVCVICLDGNDFLSLRNCPNSQNLWIFYVITWQRGMKLIDGNKASN
jgi:hypothetical protein